MPATRSMPTHCPAACAAAAACLQAFSYASRASFAALLRLTCSTTTELPRSAAAAERSKITHALRFASSALCKSASGDGRGNAAAPDASTRRTSCTRPVACPARNACHCGAFSRFSFLAHCTDLPIDSAKARICIPSAVDFLLIPIISFPYLHHTLSLYPSTPCPNTPQILHFCHILNLLTQLSMKNTPPHSATINYFPHITLHHRFPNPHFRLHRSPKPLVTQDTLPSGKIDSLPPHTATRGDKAPPPLWQ